MKYIFILLIIVLVLPWSLAQQYQFDNYSGEDGLAQSQVYAVLEDSRGFIWLGTQGGGINRYDGKTFETFRRKDGLPNDFVDVIYEDQQGILWIGTHQGLSSYNGLEFKNYFPEQTQDFAISAILEKTKEVYWVGTRKGLYLLENRRLSKVADIPSAKVNHLFGAADGSTWVSTSVGLYQIKADQVFAYGSEEAVYHKDFRCVSQDAAGHVWAGTYTGGIYIVDKGGMRRMTVLDGIRGQHVQTIYRDRAGNMWIGTQDRGLSVWSPVDSSFSYLSESNGLVRNDVRSVTEDTWGNVWVGTTGGLSKYFGRQFEHISVNTSSNDDYVYALSEDTLGHLWVSVSGKGIAQIKDGEIIRYGRDLGFVDVRCKAIFVDSENQVWVGTEGRGLALYDGKGFNFFSEKGLNESFVKDILEDRAGNIWVATAGAGLVKIAMRDTMIVVEDHSAVGDSLDLTFAADTFALDTIYNRMYTIDRFKVSEVSSYIYAIHEDADGRIWYTTRNRGVGVIENDSVVHRFDRRNYLPDNHVRSIVGDKEGFLWLGTANAGICRIRLQADSLELYNVKEADGLNANNVYLLAFDESQNLWAGCGKGIDRLDLDASRSVIKVKHYDKSDGFLGVETCTNAALKDRSGRLWFGTVKGLTLHIPESRGKDLQPPKVYISQVQVGLEPLAQSSYSDWADNWGGIKADLVVPFQENKWAFEFRGVNQSKPDEVQYKWKLEGWDDDWLGPSRQNFMAYSRLTPGAYTFLVKASNEDGVFDRNTSSVSFFIEPPFWQTWWFKLGAILLGVALVALFIRMRINRVRREAAAKTERLEMEKSIIQLEQKALQLQMNPHFIFNVLNSIQSLISKKDEKTARYFLAKFSKLMRSILENSRETKITLQQEIETLDHYLGIEQFSRGNSFDYEIEVDPRLETEEVMIPPMLLQPFVENAIIHGVGQVSEGGKIKIDFIQKYGTLECIIEDNGPGIEKARERKSQQAHTHKSAALEVTQERLDLLNAGIQNRSLEIIDRAKSGSTESGTQVILRLIMR